MEYITLLKLIEGFNFNGVSFVAIKGYCSDSSENSEIADVLINVGASYGNMKEADIETLKGAKLNDLVNDNFGHSLIEQALTEKLQSLVKPNEVRSNGQKEAYISLNDKGTLKYCKETGSVLISGTVVRKNVIKAGIYKEVKSRPLTLAKKHIEKVLDLKTSKIRYYKIANITSKVKVSGETIEIE